MTQHNEPGRPWRPVGLLDTLRLVTGLEPLSQRHAARTLRTALQNHAREAVITSRTISTQLSWKGPGIAEGLALIFREDSRTVVDMWLTELDQPTAVRIAEAAGQAPDTSIGMTEAGQWVLHLTGLPISEATQALGDFVRSLTPTRLDVAQLNYDEAKDELVEALAEDLAHQVRATYPSAAWLIIDDVRDLSDDGLHLFLRAVLDADGLVLHEGLCSHNKGEERQDPWGSAVEGRLADLEDHHATERWTWACGTPRCGLTYVPLTRKARVTEAQAPLEGTFAFNKLTQTSEAPPFRYAHSDHN